MNIWKYFERLVYAMLALLVGTALVGLIVIQASAMTLFNLNNAVNYVNSNGGIAFANTVTANVTYAGYADNSTYAGDSDKLDGQHGAYYAPIANPAFTDHITVGGYAPFGFLGGSAQVISSDCSVLQKAYGSFLNWLGWPVYVCDGTADDVQINAAISALPAAGGTVQLSDGQFNDVAPITSAKTALHLRGNGPNQTIIYLTSGSNCNMFQSPDTTSRTLKISDLQFNGNKAGNASGHGINVNYYNGAKVANVVVNYCKQDGLFASNSFTGLHLDAVISSYNDGSGAHFRGQGDWITDCWFWHNGVYGLWIYGGGDYSISNVVCESNPTGAYLAISNSKIGLMCLSNTTDGLLLNGTNNEVSLYSRLVSHFHLYLYDASYNNINLTISDTNETAGSSAIGYAYTSRRNTIKANVSVPGYFLYNSGVGAGSLADTVIESSVIIADSGFYGGGNPSVFPIVRNNSGYITESSGTATILAGNTVATVTHGLSYTPTAGDIVATPTTLMGSASYLYISNNATATQFWVNSNVNPVSANVTFAWKAGKN